MKQVNKIYVDFNPDVVYLSHLGNLPDPIIFYFFDRKIPLVFDDGGLGMVYVLKKYHQGLYLYNNVKDSRVKKSLKGLFRKTVNLLSGNLLCPDATWSDNFRWFFNNEHSRKYAQRMGVPIGKEKKIYSGTDTSNFQFENHQRIGSPIKIIVPSRIEPQKGIIDAVHLIDLLRRNNLKAKLTIVGYAGSENYFEQVMEKIDQLGIGDNVEFLGMVDHQRLAKLYRESDVCFFPSYHHSGLSRVTLEAMASGCLFISYGNEASKEIVSNGKNGFFVDEGDLNACKDVILKMVQDSEKYQSVIKEAYQTILRDHTMDVYIGKIEAFLKETIQLST